MKNYDVLSEPVQVLVLAVNRMTSRDYDFVKNLIMESTLSQGHEKLMSTLDRRREELRLGPDLELDRSILGQRRQLAA